MRLILVRHGKAQDRTNDQNDSKRELLPKGTAQAESAAFQIKPLITRCSNVYIWASPLIRSWQTAKILEEILEIQYMQQKDFVADGTADQLVKEMKKLDDTDCVIVVGHEPYLGEWAYQIAGRRVQFKKGQVAVLDFRDLGYVSDSLVVLERE